MAGVRDRRLAALEERFEPASPEDELRKAISHEVLARLTDPELRAYVAALRHLRAAMQAGKEFDGDGAIFGRVERLRGEVERELARSPS